MSGPPPKSLALRTPRQRAGDAAEAAACAHLEAAGLRVLARNVRYRDGELDVVCAEGPTVVFVEVRMRSGSGFGGAAASIDGIKQNRILRCAQRWLQARHGNRWPGCRFDVITVDRHGALDWLKNAFGAR